jgi:hypothetical protein
MRWANTEGVAVIAVPFGKGFCAGAVRKAAIVGLQFVTPICILSVAYIGASDGAYAAWLVSITWWRFFLLSMVLIVSMGIIHDLTNISRGLRPLFYPLTTALQGNRAHGPRGMCESRYQFRSYWIAGWQQRSAQCWI